MDIKDQIKNALTGLPGSAYNISTRTLFSMIKDKGDLFHHALWERCVELLIKATRHVDVMEAVLEGIHSGKKLQQLCTRIIENRAEEKDIPYSAYLKQFLGCINDIEDHDIKISVCFMELFDAFFDDEYKTFIGRQERILMEYAELDEIAVLIENFSMSDIDDVQKAFFEYFCGINLASAFRQGYVNYGSNLFLKTDKDGCSAFSYWMKTL